MNKGGDYATGPHPLTKLAPGKWHREQFSLPCDINEVILHLVKIPLLQYQVCLFTNKNLYELQVTG